jgi:hypothetical protein
MSNNLFVELGNSMYLNTLNTWLIRWGCAQHNFSSTCISSIELSLPETSRVTSAKRLRRRLPAHRVLRNSRSLEIIILERLLKEARTFHIYFGFKSWRPWFSWAADCSWVLSLWTNHMQKWCRLNFWCSWMNEQFQQCRSKLKHHSHLTKNLTEHVVDRSSIL